MDASPARGRVAHEESMLMELTVTEAEATELRDLLDGSLGDLSSEIAATDNPSYRLSLKERRTRLQAIRAQLGTVGQPVG
jgi:hypothetical protein